MQACACAPLFTGSLGVQSHGGGDGFDGPDRPLQGGGLLPSLPGRAACLPPVQVPPARRRLALDEVLHCRPVSAPYMMVLRPKSPESRRRSSTMYYGAQHSYLCGCLHYQHPTYDVVTLHRMWLCSAMFQHHMRWRAAVFLLCRISGTHLPRDHYLRKQLTGGCVVDDTRFWACLHSCE